MGIQKQPLSGRVLPYHRWLLDRLIGRMGSARSNVLDAILQAWVKAESQQLQEWGIAYTDYEREMSRPREIGTPAEFKTPNQAPSDAPGARAQT